MIGIVGALPWELAELRGRIRVESHLRHGHGRIWEGRCRGRRVILIQGGMGRERAEGAAKFLLDRYPLSALLCIGFGGGVSEELRVGDIVVCPSLYRGAEGSAPEEWSLEGEVRSDKGLIARAVEALTEQGIPFHLGDGLTVSRILADPNLKERIGKGLPVKVVDMEGFWVARQASRRGVPLLAARAISDPVDQSLPDLEGLLDAGGEAWAMVAISHLLRHPSQAPALLRLAWNARKAGASLGAFIPALIGRL